VEEGTKYYEVTVHIGDRDKFLEMKPWCVTATGSHLIDTYQLVARKALKYLSQMYEWHLGPTSMKYFPPLDRNRLAWEARVQTLESLASQEDDPTVVTMSGYLLALDKLCDLQHVQVRRMTACVEAAEACWRKARVELAKAEARAAHTESVSLLWRKSYWSRPTATTSSSEACIWWNAPKERSTILRVPTRPSWREFRCFPRPGLIKGCASQCRPLY
jgi:hypothetical protein